MELLVVIGIVMLVIALALPALARSREVARRTTCAAQLAGHSVVMAAYAVDFRDAFPYPLRHDRSEEVVLIDGTVLRPDYALLCGFWQIPVLDAYRDNPFHQSLICPSDRQTKDEIRRISETNRISVNEIRASIRYTMSMAMFFAPEALNPAAPIDAVGWRVGQRHSDVVFPASKAAIFEVIPFHDPQFTDPANVRVPNLRNIASADGAVAFRSTRDVMPGVVFNPPADPNYRELAGEANKLLYTPWGVRGRDW